MQGDESAKSTHLIESSDPKNGAEKNIDNAIDNAGAAALTGAVVGAGVVVAMVPVFMLGAIKFAYSPNAPIPFFSSPILNTAADYTLQALLAIGGTCLLLAVAPPAILYSHIFGEAAREESENMSIVTLAATTGAVLGLAGYGAYRLFKNTTTKNESPSEPAVEQLIKQQNNS